MDQQTRKERKERKELLRIIITFDVVLCVLAIAFWALEAIPLPIEEALIIQEELSVPSTFQVVLLTLALLTCFVLHIVGLFRLWQFDSRGMILLLIARIFPFFLIVYNVAVYGAITDYLIRLEGCVIGVICASCAFAPELFEVSEHVVEDNARAEQDGAADE